jgi:predicted nucleic acid-binding protein
LPRNLGSGETAAIALALQLRPDFIILDDGAARLAARGFGIKAIGVLGILLSAKERGFIEAIRCEIDALMAASFRVSPAFFGTS